MRAGTRCMLAVWLATGGACAEPCGETYPGRPADGRYEFFSMSGSADSTQGLESGTLSVEADRVVLELTASDGREYRVIYEFSGAD